MSTLDYDQYRPPRNREKAHPSIEIEPLFSSTIRNRASISELFPAPVLNQRLNRRNFATKNICAPPNDTDLLPALDAESNTLQDIRKAFSVAESNILHFDRSLLRPGFLGLLLLDFMGRLLRNKVSSTVLDN